MGHVQRYCDIEGLSKHGQIWLYKLQQSKIDRVNRAYQELRAAIADAAERGGACQTELDTLDNWHHDELAAGLLHRHELASEGLED